NMQPFGCLSRARIITSTITSHPSPSDASRSSRPLPLPAMRGEGGEYRAQRDTRGGGGRGTEAGTSPAMTAYSLPGIEFMETPTTPPARSIFRRILFAILVVEALILLGYIAVAQILHLDPTG